MPDALEEDRRARADEHAWLLARLVWPASRLDELEGEDRALSVLLDGPYGGDMRAEAVETRWDAGLDGLERRGLRRAAARRRARGGVAALAERGLRAKVRCGGAEVPSADALGRFLARVPRRGRSVQGDRRAPPSARGGGPARLPQRARRLRVRGRRRADRRGRADAGGAALARPRGRRRRSSRAFAREQLVAVGSCSFFEPVDDLQELGIL